MSVAPLSPIALRRIAEALEVGTPAEQRAATDALRALVLPAWRFAERDALIIQCRRDFFADRSNRHAAQEIEIGLKRYEASGWRSGGRSAPSCPDRIAGTAKGTYWAILKASPRPLSGERIRKLLNDSAK